MKKNIDRIHKFLWRIKVSFQERKRRWKYQDKLKANLVFQGKHKDEQRCFVVGNGPSLSENDLDKIARGGYVSFGSNSIFKLYADTDWRPTYYSVCDTTYFNKMRSDIESVKSIKFIPLDILDQFVENKHDYYAYSRNLVTIFDHAPIFTDNLTKSFGEGATVTYHLLQLAVAMGFKEIYLLGCDFNYSCGIGPDGKPIKDNGVTSDHLKQDNTPIFTPPNLYNNLRAFKVAEEYSRKHGIRIYNATRGGKLEVFERKEFDSLFETQE